MLLALRPLMEVANERHEGSKTNEEMAPFSKKLIDAIGLTSQAVYKLNVICVSLFGF